MSMHSHHITWYMQTHTDAEKCMCTQDFVSSSGCELDGTVHNVSHNTVDGCQTCRCKVSIRLTLYTNIYQNTQ